jgi:hypothetical protein
MAEVLVDGFSANSVVAGEDDFWDAAAGALDEFGCPFRCQGLLSSLVHAALLGQGDTFPLTLPYEGAFEFGEGSHDSLQMSVFASKMSVDRFGTFLNQVVSWRLPLLCLTKVLSQACCKHFADLRN